MLWAKNVNLTLCSQLFLKMKTNIVRKNKNKITDQIQLLIITNYLWDLISVFEFLLLLISNKQI